MFQVSDLVLNICKYCRFLTKSEFLKKSKKISNQFSRPGKISKMVKGQKYCNMCLIMAKWILFSSRVFFDLDGSQNMQSQNDKFKNCVMSALHCSSLYICTVHLQRKIPIKQNIFINYFFDQFHFRLASCVKFNHQGIDSTLPYCLASSFRCHNICYHWCWVVYGTASHDMFWQHNR